MSRSKTIGIIGSSGDLGSKLSAQIRFSGMKVISYDIDIRSNSEALLAVDPSIEIPKDLASETAVGKIAELIELSDIIHITAPLSAVKSIKAVTKDKLLVFHASVMKQSHDSINILTSNADIECKTAVVHCLMNQNATVVVSDLASGAQDIEIHLKEIGLVPVVMAADKHDHSMAISQAPMAILHDLFADDLLNFDARHLLTPSGEDFMTALNARAAKWTPETLKSILGNPAIPNIIELMKERIADINQDKVELTPFDVKNDTMSTNE